MESIPEEPKQIFSILFVWTNPTHKVCCSHICAYGVGSVAGEEAMVIRIFFEGLRETTNTSG